MGKIVAKVGYLVKLYFIYESSSKEEVYITITSPSFKEYRVLAFNRGGNRWSARFVAQEDGEYLFKLLDKEAKVNITSSSEKISNFNYIKLSKDKRYLVDSQDKPFFWLSDTWWMALSSRLSWEDFVKLANIRRKQGFNVIQLVAGLMPDVDRFDERAFNSEGYPFDCDTGEINPAYFDEADKRVKYLVNLGFSVMIVGSWGYYLNIFGKEKMQEFWRYIVARWGSLNVVWCIAGETTMPYYLSKNRSLEQHDLKSGWSELAQYIRDIEAFGRLITTHPIESSIEEIDSSLLDINLLQASHNSFDSLQKGISLLEKEQSIPTIMDEINYEGILRGNGDYMQRLCFWSSILRGSKGFGYGANGIWQVNKENEPFGASASGANWGNMPYNDAIELKGAKDIARAKEFLKEFKWWELEPKNIDISPSPNPAFNISMAGISDTLRIVYIYEQLPPWHNVQYTIKNLKPNAQYKVYFWSPSFKSKIEIDPITTNNHNLCNLPTPPSLDEWVLVLEFEKSIQIKENLTPIKRIGNLFNNILSH